jgi:hypothetical protein
MTVAPLRLGDVAPPTTPAAIAAREVTTRYASPALANHAVRSYVWGVAYAHLFEIEFDDELFYVAAMLHDLGLEEPFDSYRLPFEDAGGELGWVFAAGAGWDPARRERVAQVVVRHMWDEVDPRQDPEGHLLERATTLDISGGRAELWPADFVGEVLSTYPRLDLRERFVRCFEDQAARKPHSRAADAVKNGIADRMARSPLERRTGESS